MDYKLLTFPEIIYLLIIEKKQNFDKQINTELCDFSDFDIKLDFKTL